MMDRMADVVFVLASAGSFVVVVMITMLIASQLAGVARRIEWWPWFYCSVSLWLIWVLIRG